MSDNSEGRVRGEVYNQEAFDQKMLFSGMTYERNITPSDWDFFIDFGGELFIYGEGKKEPSELTIGQKKSLEHVCDSHNRANHVSVGFMFHHNISAPNPVYVKDQTVVKYYWYGQWVDLPQKPKVSEFIDKIINWCKSKNIKI